MIVNSVSAIFEAELTNVVWSLRVAGRQGLDLDFVLLLVGELLLIDATHVGLVDEGHVIFVFDVISFFLFGDDGVSLSSTSRGSTSGGATSSSSLALHD